MELLHYPLLKVTPPLDLRGANRGECGGSDHCGGDGVGRDDYGSWGKYGQEYMAALRRLHGNTVSLMAAAVSSSRRGAIRLDGRVDERVNRAPSLCCTRYVARCTPGWASNRLANVRVSCTQMGSKVRGMFNPVRRAFGAVWAPSTRRFFTSWAHLTFLLLRSSGSPVQRARSSAQLAQVHRLDPDALRKADAERRRGRSPRSIAAAWHGDRRAARSENENENETENENDCAGESK